MPYMSGGSLAERVAQHGPAPADEVERQARRLLGALAVGPPRRHRAPRHQARQRAVRRPGRAVPGRLRRRAQPRPDPRAHGGRAWWWARPGFMAPEQARGEPVVARHRRVLARAPRCCSPPPARARTATGDPGLLMVRAASGKVERGPQDRCPSSLRRLLRAMLDPATRSSAHGRRAGRRGPDGTVRPHAHGGAPAGGAAVGGRGLGGALAATALVVALACAVARPAARDPADDAARPTPGTPSACEDLPYQPCGGPTRPRTPTARTCVDDHADYDGRSGQRLRGGARRRGRAAAGRRRSRPTSSPPTTSTPTRSRSTTTCSCSATGSVERDARGAAGRRARPRGARQRGRCHRRGHRQRPSTPAVDPPGRAGCGSDDEAVARGRRPARSAATVCRRTTS